MTISLASLASGSPHHKQSDWGAPAFRVAGDRALAVTNFEGKGIWQECCGEGTATNTRAACALWTSVSSA
jgi:hypothetical protein